MTKIRITKARRKISAHRDKAGVPHIAGQSWLDVLYGLGYMHATDRGTQLLFSRAVASGCGAETITDSPELLETDRFFRRIGLYRNLDNEVRELDDRTFDQLTAYCEGVNDGIRASGRSLPMWATGFQPSTWDQTAVLLIGKLISFGGLAVSQLQNERLLLEMIHAGVDDEGLRELFAPLLDDVDFELLRQVQMSNQLSDDALELITDLPRLAGSNAWAVAPHRSATGSALLASDPHLEVNRLPAIWYEAVLSWGDEYVMGASLPGCPLFATGRTQRVAWGVTYLKGDTIDFFIEDCRRGGETAWQYRRRDSWYDFRVREEVIHRKGTDAETVRVYYNPQGTLESDPDRYGSGYHLSLAWTGNADGAGHAMATWLEIVGADSTRSAMEVASRCVQPSLCWILADVDGHIGMQTCGRFPQRKTDRRTLTPLPAWDEQNHWSGFVPVSQFPSIYDPPEGFVATANEDPSEPGGPKLVVHPVPDYRKRRIDERLRQLHRATIQDMQQLQYDLVSVHARDLLNAWLPHMRDSDVKRRLMHWDYRFDPDSIEASLFQNLYRNVMMEVFGHEAGVGWRRMLYLCTRAGFSTMVLTAADKILGNHKSYWWRDRGKGNLIRRAAEALDLESAVPWSEINNFHFTDRFFGNHRVGRLLGFNSFSYPMPGCHATPFQGHVMQTAKRETTFSPSYHFVTDLNTDHAWTNLPGGPSESRFSRYYKSDIDLWFQGKYKQLNVRSD